MDEGLEAELPPVLRLALAHAPGRSREATLALFALDTRLAGFVRRGSEPLGAQMRLAWWRETLGSPPAGWPTGDPLLELLRGWRAPERLVALIDGWERLLAEWLDRQAITDFAGGRMQGWSALADQVGAQEAGVEPAAKAWALGDLAANLSGPVERALVLAVAKEETGYIPPGGRSLRPLAILGGLGRRALARGGAPLFDGRRAALAALRLGLFGR
jgi:phytoene synthase